MRFRFVVSFLTVCCMVVSSSSFFIVTSSSLTSTFATTLSENAFRSAVNKTECAHPASFPHSFRNRFPIAAYVAAVRLLCLPLPNL